MFNRKIIDLTVLTIINSSPDGLTAYSIVKELKDTFSSFWDPSPGTVYPLLKRMVQTGDLMEINIESSSTPLYKISEQGKTKLNEKVIATFNKSIEFIPSIMQKMIPFIPLQKRIAMIYDFPRFSMGFSNCMCDFDNIFAHGKPLCTQFSTLSESLEQLNGLKNKLEDAKLKIKSWVDTEIQRIDENITKIDAQIQHCQDEKKKWKRIPVDDETNT
jgi:DNA-binding PadR family transcriptional regulator